RFLPDYFSLAEQSGKPIRGIDRSCVAAVLSVAHLPFGRGPAIRAFVVVFRLGALFSGASACGEFRAHDGAFVCRALSCAADALLRPDPGAQSRNLRIDPTLPKHGRAKQAANSHHM